MGLRVKGYVQFNEQLILVRLESKPKDTIIVQVYVLTTGYNDQEVDNMYGATEAAISKVKGDENLIVLGDMSAVVREGKEEDIVGKYGLGQRNERGDTLVEFCAKNQLVLTNTWFYHHKRRRYTWEMPTGQDV